jgi:phage terminase large subunit-like protein
LRELDPTKSYALDVVSGKEVAGPLVRLACERHLRDLVDGPSRGLKWDQSAADHALGYFANVLRLAGGEHEGKPFVLHPSQQFIIGSLFGWKSADGFRRFRVAYIEQGKGNGKTPLAAGIGLYMLTADKEPRAEIYAAATDQDQAKILFRDAVAMVDQSKALDSRIQRSGGKGREWNLAYLATGSFFRPISSEHVGGRGKSGFRPHCALLDEVHEHPSAAMVEFMRAGTKGRRQALILMITNAGVYDPNAVAFHYHEYSSNILNQQIDNDSFFAYVCGLDKGDDWKDPAVWRKTNPLLSVSISEKYLQEQVLEAVGMPSKQSIVRRLSFCEWVESSDPFVEPEVWNANAGKVPADQLAGLTCYGGLDLSGKNDLTALQLVFPLDDGSKAVLPFFWTPGEGVRQRADRDGAPYERWIREGHIIAKPGTTIDYGWIAHKLGELSGIYRIEAVAFDRWRIDDLKRELEDLGIGAWIYNRDNDNGGICLVEHGQGYKDMSPAVEALEDDLKEVRLRHGGHPVLSWCVANAKVVSDPAGLRKFDKRKATGRIDGAVALAMASNLSVFFHDDKTVSYSEVRSVA